MKEVKEDERRGGRSKRRDQPEEENEAHDEVVDRQARGTRGVSEFEGRTCLEYTVLQHCTA